MHALVTSASRKIPMLEAVRRALRAVVPQGRLFGGDSNPRCIARAFVDEFWGMPPDEDLTFDALAEYCDEHGIGWLVPSRDGELAQLSRWRLRLEELGIQVMVSSPATVTACTDKLEFSRKLGVLPEAVPATQELRPEIANRWAVKERFGAGSRRVSLNVPMQRALEEAGTFTDPVYQPFIEGSEYSIDLYRSRKGEVWGCVVRTRDLVVQGESQRTTVVNHERLRKVCIRAAGILELEGHAVFQAIEDRSGGLHLIECNARFGGASTLSVAAGLDSFAWFFRETGGKGFAPAEFVTGIPGLTLFRYPADRIVLPESMGI